MVIDISQVGNICVFPKHGYEITESGEKSEPSEVIAVKIQTTKQEDKSPDGRISHMEKWWI